MRRRLTIASLWFLAALYAGSMLHGIAGLHELVGPVVGLASAGLIVVDPFRRLAADRVPAPIGLPASPAQDDDANPLSEAA